MITKWNVVEVVSKAISCELGDFAQYHVDRRGSTKAAIKSQPRLMFDTQAKNCLGNLVPGLSEATTIVHIPDRAIGGESLSAEDWRQAFWFACDQFGVPMWTQSSIKSRTFYFVAPEMFAKLASKWNLSEDGARFAVYESLLFSDVDSSDPLYVELDAIEDAPDGKDGSCEVSPEFWGNRTCQLRAIAQDTDGIPTAIAKGIAVPVRGQGNPKLNKNQVKFGGPGEFVILRNQSVGSSRILNMWVSAEPLLMLKDTPFVRNFLAQRVMKEVGRLLEILADPVALLKYLGGLELDEAGELGASKRAVEEALRSNLPMCKEIEERVTRFATRLIAEKVIPSGAISGRASVMVISEKHGVAPCALKDAKVIAFRIPLTGANAVIPLPKDPYVRGKGMVVKPEVAKMASGDDDADLLIVVDEPEVVELFREYLDMRIVSGLKPAKTRAKVSLTREAMEDMALEQIDSLWEVGALNVAGWKMIQVGKFDIASSFLDYANIQPMTLKWHIEFDGVPFSEAMGKLYRAHAKELAGIKLAWRDASLESRAWDSPRDMCSKQVAVSSHLDACWNAGVEAACAWNAKHPLKPLSISTVARLAFGQSGIVIPGSAWREARDMIGWWGGYWTQVHEEGREKEDHSAAYRHAAEWGRNASREAAAAMLVWMPKNAENTGFALKWATVFAGGRAVDVLGYRPSVAEAIKEMRGHRQDLLKQAALVEAVLENIQF